MADEGHVKTDEILEELEKKIRKEYEQANKEVQQTLDEFLEQFQNEDEQKKKLVDSGEWTNKKYYYWRYTQIREQKRWQALKDQLAEDYTNANGIARSMAQGYMPEVYALNHNFAAYQVQHDANMDISWTLYNREAVEYLMKENPQLLPNMSERTRQQITADKLWNRQHINSAITQGILQGDAIPDISKRLQRVTDMNTAAATRNARTMMTSVENKARQDAYDRLREKGVELQEMWMATLDSRTRHSHRALHGTYKDPKTGEYANGLRYPADPMGDPEEIYNCRCCEIAEVEGAKVGAPNYSPKMKGMTFDEWLQGGSGHPKWMYPEETQSTVEPVGLAIVQGKDISSTWERRTDQFQFEIEDVMNAQGFDGLPRVVSDDEFDKYVKQANGGNGFIAERAYSAPDIETLNAYREQLYRGKWYVDCSTNGAAYGQGMYGTADFNGHITDEMEKASEFYSKFNRQNPVSFVERFTISSDAKVIKYETLYDEFKQYGMNVEEKNTEIRRNEASNADREFLSQLLNKSGFEGNENARKFLAGNVHLETVGWEEMGMIYQSLSDSEKEALKNLTNEYYSGMNDFRKNYIDEKLIYEIKDIGSYATSKGYDVIDVSGRGVAGSNECVILNRTKVIFMDGNND